MNEQDSATSTAILDASGHIAVNLPCVRCRYNLRTQPVSANCPECAHPVIETLTRYLPTLDHLGRVAQDLLCTSCGYNLRTLALTGICPECTAPVAQSARGRFLHLAPPLWLKRIDFVFEDRRSVFSKKNRANNLLFFSLACLDLEPERFKIGSDVLKDLVTGEPFV